MILVWLSQPTGQHTGVERDSAGPCTWQEKKQAVALEVFIFSTPYSYQMDVVIFHYYDDEKSYNSSYLI